MQHGREKTLLSMMTKGATEYGDVAALVSRELCAVLESGVLSSRRHYPSARFCCHNTTGSLIVYHGGVIAKER